MAPKKIGIVENKPAQIASEDVQIVAQIEFDEEEKANLTTPIRNSSEENEYRLQSEIVDGVDSNSEGEEDEQINNNEESSSSESQRSEQQN